MKVQPTPSQSRDIFSVPSVNNLAYTEEKPRNTEFPLDHILPVFNLSKKDSQFIPTLKVKQKETLLVAKEKKGGVMKGSTVLGHNKGVTAGLNSEITRF